MGQELPQSQSLHFSDAVDSLESKHEMYGQNVDEYVGCGEAVEILTRNMHRGTYISLRRYFTFMAFRSYADCYELNATCVNPVH